MKSNWGKKKANIEQPAQRAAYRLAADIKPQLDA
jgi:hypothetical protein